MRVSVRRAARCSFLLVLSASATIEAQTPPQIAVKLDVEHPAQWTSIVGVRELKDGRLVVLDARDQALKLVDMKSPRPTMIGRKGSGPGEYQLPLRLFALPADSSVIFDMANSGSPMVVTPRGAAGGVLPGQAGGGFLDMGSEVDGSGRIYRTSRDYDRRGIAAIERLERRTSRVDTVAYTSRRIECSFATRPPPATDTGSRRPAFARGRTTGPAFLQLEQWAVAADGRIAVFCPDPYRVVLIDANGSRVNGPPILYEPIRVSEAEKRRWRDEQQQPVASIRVTSAGQTAGYTPSQAPTDPDSWPVHLPPFVPAKGLNGAVRFAPDGLLWVERTFAANASPTYDVVGRDGRVAYRVTLPKRTRVVGFGANSIYAVRRDDDDIEYLQRLRLVTVGGRP